MTRQLRWPLKAVLVAAIIFSLLPLSILMLYGIALSGYVVYEIIFVTRHAPSMEVLAAYGLIGCIEFIACYALYSLWWLIIKHNKMTLRHPPRNILVGILAGIVINLVLIAGIVYDVGIGVISSRKSLGNVFSLVCSFGPIVIVIVVALLMRANRETVNTSANGTSDA